MINNYLNYRPNIDESCYIAETADIVGRVTLKENVSVWYNTVIRADVNDVVIGKNTNVQDGVVIHQSDDYACLIGEGVTIGHSAIVHACTIEDNVLIGMGAIILDGAYIEKNVIIGAGTLITKGKRIKSGSIVVGNPAKVIRTLTDEEVEAIKYSAKKYVRVSNEYKESKKVNV